MLKLLSQLLLVLILLPLISISSAGAVSPRSYYDWSSTLETKNSSVLGIEAFSGESTPSAKITLASLGQFNNYLFVGNFTPDNPLYFAKTLQENVQLTLTFDAKKKEEMRLYLAGERMEEMKQMLDSNKPQAVETAALSYDQTIKTVADNIEDLKNQNQDVKDLVKKVEEETAKHTVVLEEVALKAPDQAKDAIEKAIEASWKGTDKAADLSGRPAVPADVVDRLQALKTQGLLTEEEVNKLIAAKTRTEAREEIKKYVTEGVVPEADFLRMNENVKAYYKDEFFKLHEMKRFYEMKKLESEKPNETILKKIQEFAKSYKPGEVVPADIRKYWVPVVRLEEIQNTIRPDLLDESLLKSNGEDYKKFQEVVERFKPRPEDIAYLENYLKKNPNSSLPPEYERMKHLADKYGASCGADKHWEPLPQGGGVCVPNDMKSEDSKKWKDLPRIEDFAKGKVCSGQIVNVKNPEGICSTYPADCVPAGWSKVSSCIETSGQSEKDNGTFKQISCPTNSHWVNIPFMPNGGYCIANYTPVYQSTVTAAGSQTESACPSDYHRSYPGGPCLQDYGTTITVTTYTLPPLTSAPGQYPSPFYSQQQKCDSGSYWVPEPVNPSGGYCATDYTGGRTPPPDSAATYTTTSGGSTTTTTGTSGTTSCRQPDSGCGNNSYWDQVGCACRSTSSYPSTCSYPSGGCGTGKYWDSASCTCKTSTTSGSTDTYTPPSGYGSCSSGQYWNGSVCVVSTYQSKTPEQMCKETPNCSWTGSSCNCSSQVQPTSVPQPTSASQSTQPTAAPQPTTPPVNDPASECSKAGGSWNGSSCQMPSTSSGGSGSTSDPATECSKYGGSWTGSSCQMPGTQ